MKFANAIATSNYDIICLCETWLTGTLICGDVNLPNANWIDYSSTENEEKSIVELIEQHQFEQAIDFPTCGKNTLDITFSKIVTFMQLLTKFFAKIYNWSDHKAISIIIECPHHEVKFAIENFRSFGSVEYNEIKKSIPSEPFSPVCHTNINRMCEELYDYLEILVNLEERDVANHFRHGLRQVPQTS